MYVIILHKALASPATATLESVILDIFRSSCARIVPSGIAEGIPGPEAGGGLSYDSCKGGKGYTV